MSFRDEDDNYYADPGCSGCLIVIAISLALWVVIAYSLSYIL